MASFSNTSRGKLATCHEDLQKVFMKVIEGFDCTVLCGHRTKEEQNKAYSEGNSTKKWPNSRHNTSPSEAVDVAPYPIDWEDRDRFHLFAGYVLGVAASMGIKLRFGGDWDRDTEVDDNDFDDLVHFELDN